jgi:hypothetical protein
MGIFYTEIYRKYSKQSQNIDEKHHDSEDSLCQTPAMPFIYTALCPP